MKIAISAESAIDLPKELLEKYKINTIPFTINFNDELVEDRFGISEEIFAFVEKTKKLPHTSAISPEQYRKYFDTLKKNFDAIIHISLSSGMSCTYNNAQIVAEEMENVFVLDSKSLSGGIALLAIKARQLIDENHSPEEIFKTLQDATSQLAVSAVIEKVNYLFKGGRCSALALLGANILKIKPQIVVNNGKTSLGKKYIGSLNKVADKYIKDLLEANPNPILDYAIITHTTPMPEVEAIITRALKERGFVNVHSILAGGTIASHCGPNCVGIMFFNNK